MMSLVRVLGAMLLCLVSLSTLAAPAHVLIVAPPGTTAPPGFAAQLASWRQSGEVANALLLEESQPKDPGFASLALLEFPSEGSFEHWSKEEAAKIKAPLTYKREDVIVHGEVYPRDSNKSVFLVNT